jgi:hypothetical protein
MQLEEAVRIGMELRRIVSTESFDKAVEALKEQYRSQVFNSKPGDHATRERAYMEAHALDELLITFNTFIAIAEADVLDVDEDQLEIFE